jgi:hypothetical protein
MAMNRIQFQRGMSLPEFLRSFGTEAACAQAVMAARRDWRHGRRGRCHEADSKHSGYFVPYLSRGPGEQRDDDRGLDGCGHSQRPPAGGPG